MSNVPCVRGRGNAAAPPSEPSCRLARRSRLPTRASSRHPRFPPFTGFAPAAFDWFAQLAGDNSRAFFARTRDVWAAHVRDPLTGLLGELAAHDGGSVRLFRQHRDARFARTADPARPIKETTYGVITARPGTEAGLYVELSARGLFAGTGAYQLAADQLSRYRTAVLADATGAPLAAEVARLERAGYVVLGAALQGVPRGVPREHARAGLLRRKELPVGRWLAPDAAEDRRRVLAHVRGTWDGAAALNAWFDAHVGASTIPPEIRWGGGRAAQPRRTGRTGRVAGGATADPSAPSAPVPHHHSAAARQTAATRPVRGGRA
jgi:uncharacterized protein (DUF2461 family)